MTITVLLILLGAIAGAILFRRKNAVLAWIFFCNLAFSVFVTVTAGSCIQEQLQRKGITEVNPYLAAACLLVVTVLLLLVLMAFSLRLLPENARKVSLPEKSSRIVSFCFSALAGSLIAAFLISTFYVTPASAVVPGERRKEQARSANQYVTCLTAGMDLNLPNTDAANRVTDVFRIYQTPEERQAQEVRKASASVKDPTVKKRKTSKRRTNQNQNQKTEQH